MSCQCSSLFFISVHVPFIRHNGRDPSRPPSPERSLQSAQQPQAPSSSGCSPRLDSCSMSFTMNCLDLEGHSASILPLRRVCSTPHLRFTCQCLRVSGLERMPLQKRHNIEIIAMFPYHVNVRDGKDRGTLSAESDTKKPPNLRFQRYDGKSHELCRKNTRNPRNCCVIVT